MWPGGKVGDQFAPPDRPPCGFLNELCKAEKGSEVLWRNRFQLRFAFVDLFVNAFIRQRPRHAYTKIYVPEYSAYTNFITEKHHSGPLYSDAVRCIMLESQLGLNWCITLLTK